MVLSRLNLIMKQTVVGRCSSFNLPTMTMATTTKTGAVLPEPHKTRFPVIRVILTVVPGLLIGAMISKNIANFLEENDLFVPSDDDDDDD